MRESWSATCIKKKTNKQTTTTKSKTKNNKQTKKPTKTNIPVHVLLMEYSYNQRNILAPLGNRSLKKKNMAPWGNA